METEDIKKDQEATTNEKYFKSAKEVTVLETIANIILFLGIIAGIILFGINYKASLLYAIGICSVLVLTGVTAWSLFMTIGNIADNLKRIADNTKKIAEREK